MNEIHLIIIIWYVWKIQNICYRHQPVTENIFICKKKNQNLENKTFPIQIQSRHFFFFFLCSRGKLRKRWNLSSPGANQFYLFIKSLTLVVVVVFDRINELGLVRFDHPLNQFFSGEFYNGFDDQLIFQCLLWLIRGYMLRVFMSPFAV